MSSLPSTGQSANRAKDAYRHNSISNTSSPSVHEHETASETSSTPDRTTAKTWPATRSTSHQPSESSDTTLLGGFYDGGVFDNVSSVTLQDEFPWHEVDVNKSTQRIPSTIVPALLQGITNVSPSRSSFDGESGSRELDENSSELGDVVSRYSATQKGKWKAREGGDPDVMDRHGRIRSPSPQFHFEGLHDSVEDWVAHNRPVLQDYADRQTSLPLGRRLEVSIDEPPRFILGAIQLLVNRDNRDCTDHSRRLGPQLIENFVDINLWAKEYFRSRHGTQVDSDVTALLTIVINNFYEGQVQLIDRLVEFAVENMNVCGRTSLGIQDFAFGFDFKMNQDLPFYVETSSRIREPLPIRSVEVRPTSEPVITRSGREVKPTERVQEASEQAQANTSGRRNKGKNTSQVKDKEVARGPVPPSRQKKNSAEPSSQRTETLANLQAEPNAASPPLPKATTEHMKHRPARSSNLRFPPISSTIGTIPPQSNDSFKSEHSSPPSTDIPKASGFLGSNFTVNLPPRLKVVIPRPNLSASTVTMTNDPEASSSKTNSSHSQTNQPADASETTNRERVALRSRGARPRGPRNGRSPGCEQERGSTSQAPNAQILEATTDNTKSLPTEHPVDTDNAEASAAVDPPAAPSTPVYALRSTARMISRTQPHGEADNSTGTRDDGPSTSQSTHTSQLLLRAIDPGHPKRKKRKLDDCED